MRGVVQSTETPLSSFTAGKRKKKLKKINIFSRKAKSNGYTKLNHTI